MDLSGSYGNYYVADTAVVEIHTVAQQRKLSCCKYRCAQVAAAILILLENLLPLTIVLIQVDFACFSF